jgi:hypothetical protein
MKKAADLQGQRNQLLEEVGFNECKSATELELRPDFGMRSQCNGDVRAIGILGPPVNPSATFEGMELAALRSCA